MTDLPGENADIEGVRPMSHKIAAILDAAVMSRFLLDLRICSGKSKKNFLTRTDRGGGLIKPGAVKRRCRSFSQPSSLFAPFECLSFSSCSFKSRLL